MSQMSPFLVCNVAMGLPSQRVPAEEANRQRSVLHSGIQEYAQGIWHGLPGERCSAIS